MVSDVLPGLLKEVKGKFESDLEKSEVVARALKKLKNKEATYQTANDFAVEVGKILSNALRTSVKGNKLPDGKLYYNIGQRLLKDVLGANYELVENYNRKTQEQLNKLAKIGLEAQRVAFNQDRLNGIVNRLSSEDDFEAVSWMFGEPVVNFTQSIVDDSIKANADFQHKAGLKPQVTRKEGGKCCDWCREVVGTYTYPDVPKDVWRRHQRCRCTVEYDPRNGKKQDVWSKTWIDKSRSAKIEERKQITNSSEVSDVRKRALQLGITSNPIKKRSSKTSEKRIINELSGGDKTDGSCSSLAFAYIGNKSGYKVLDFRGGLSCDLFSRNGNIMDIANMDGVESFIEKHTNDFVATKKLLEKMEPNKEYYLATGGHAAIVRKSGDDVQYLELQSSNKEKNGFQKLDASVLRRRFGCKRSHSIRRRKIEFSNVLIDAETLEKNEEFHQILGFINTDKTGQLKGAGGHVK